MVVSPKLALKALSDLNMEMRKVGNIERLTLYSAIKAVCSDLVEYKNKYQDEPGFPYAHIENEIDNIIMTSAANAGLSEGGEEYIAINCTSIEKSIISIDVHIEPSGQN